MNLIEQLGGYEKSKRELELKEEDSVFQCCNAITSDMIRNALLEHRRQHNIFEIGDPYVFTEKYSKQSVIHKVDSLNSGKGCLRHAKDEEIKAGRRL